jgi:hypothetical protein
MRANHRTEADAADLLDGVDPGELPRLHSSLVDDIRVKQRTLRVVESALSTTGEDVQPEFRKVS